MMMNVDAIVADDVVAADAADAADIVLMLMVWMMLMLMKYVLIFT